MVFAGFPLLLEANQVPSHSKQNYCNVEKKNKGGRVDFQAGGRFPTRKNSNDDVVHHLAKHCLLPVATPGPTLWLQPEPPQNIVMVLPHHHLSTLCHQLR